MTEHHLDDAELVGGMDKGAFIRVNCHQSWSEYPYHVRDTHFIDRHVIHNPVYNKTRRSLTKATEYDRLHTFLDVLLAF